MTNGKRLKTVFRDLRSDSVVRNYISVAAAKADQPRALGTVIASAG